MEKEIPSVSIEIMENGPLIVKGLRTLRSSKGEALEVKEKFALCRCGASKNKPLCDGTHREIDFSGARKIDRPLDQAKAYQGEKITVHDNRVICCHAAECVTNLRSVFDAQSRPWIDADGAAADQIIEIIKKCPSGALSYSIDNVHYRNESSQPAIDISANGPYNISGAVTLDIEDELQPPSQQQYSLCRCGASKNKPYCDGTHAEIDFKDD
ncbi:CDGSH iron-sulfur domain-containing protein, partial [bacterium]|nr:CDGSH iron-sulfur domain-containing protein [bacterium]